MGKRFQGDYSIKKSGERGWIIVITKYLANSLKEIYHQAKQAGADSIEITNQDLVLRQLSNFG